MNALGAEPLVPSIVLGIAIAFGAIAGFVAGYLYKAWRSEAYIKRLEERVADAEIGHLQTAVAIAWDLLNDEDESQE